MNGRNSKVILANNIKIDKDYKNVLSYNTNNMLNLINNNKVAESDNFSFVRERGTIQVSFKYATCLMSNYIAFQNPDYSNKWFFAWIDNIKYINDNCTEINYTIDVWSTWYDSWSQKQCFVIREHINKVDDEIGANTVPEGLELGEYTCVKPCEKILFRPSDYYMCMAVTELPDETIPAYSNNRIYNGIFGGLYYLIFKDTDDIQKAILMYDFKQKQNAIISIFMIPKDLDGVINATRTQWSMGIGDNTVTCYVFYYKGNNSADTLIATIVGIMPTTVGQSYIPKNNKLFTYPFSYMNLTNNSGSTIPFKYEDFNTFDESVRQIIFQVFASISPGMSIKAVPNDYKNIANNYNYGINLGKLPVCSWTSDYYLNYMSQAGLNPLFNLTSDIMSLSNISPSNILGSSSDIYSNIHQITQAKITPDQAKGNINSGDINFSMNNDGGFTLYYMSIRDEYAKICDDYFTRFGYKINRLKIPNLSGRSKFNYIQIGSGETIGYGNIPNNFMKIINDICVSGTTIWHDHSYIGNYDDNN